MITQCPNCKNTIVVAQAGTNSCSKCKASIWITPDGEDGVDRVLEMDESDHQTPKNSILGSRLNTISQEIVVLRDAPKSSWTPPWEEREKIGVFKAFADTLKLSSLAPSKFFSRMVADRPLNGVAFYAWILITVGYLFWAIYRMAFMPMVIEAAKEATGSIPNELNFHLVTLLVVIFAPLLALLTIYSNAVFYHIVLWLLGSTKPGFRGTMRVVVYSTSPMIFMCLPFFGDLIAFVWSMALSVIGISKVHKISNAKSMLVVLLPPIALYTMLLLLAKAIQELQIAPYMLP